VSAFAPGAAKSCLSGLPNLASILSLPPVNQFQQYLLKNAPMSVKPSTPMPDKAIGFWG
jgi:hypothetical protein